MASKLTAGGERQQQTLTWEDLEHPTRISGKVEVRPTLPASVSRPRVIEELGGEYRDRRTGVELAPGEGLRTRSKYQPTASLNEVELRTKASPRLASPHLSFLRLS
ncbi:hypothetical protein U0070_018601 [Myodes glareolus]|uniref:Uncharacterized protein n=1 Tax=Myodes glareolus TaxID=447135 RepID=A0AAW0IC77_MYOGA